MDGDRRTARGSAGLLFQSSALLAYLAVVALVQVASPAADRPQTSTRLTEALARAVDGALAAIEPLAQRCGSDEPPDWRAFTRALETAGGSEPALVAWAPQVREADRADYESRTGRDAFRSFSIREPDRGGILRPASARPDHFPVHLVHPAPHSNRLLGLDLTADPTLAAAIARAARSRAAQVVFPSSIALDGEPGLVVLVPVVRGGRLAGVVVASMPAPDPAGPADQRLVTRPRSP